MERKPVFRELTLFDYDLVYPFMVELADYHESVVGQDFSPSILSLDEYIEKVENFDFHCILLSQGEEPVGCALFSIEDRESHLHFIIIKDIYRKHGYGKYFLSYIEDFLKSRNVFHYHLTVYKKNCEAVAFYRHLGFRQTNKACEHGIFFLAKHIE